MISYRSLFRVECLLKFTSTFAVSRPVNCVQGQCVYHGLSYNLKIGAGKDKQSAMDQKKKRKTVTPIWRPVCTQAISSEECLEKDVIAESKDGSQVQEVLCGTYSNISNVQHVIKASDTVTEITNSTTSCSTLQDKGEDGVLEGESELSTEKYSISVEVGASLIRFVKGKGGSTQKKIEEEMGVKIILPASKRDDSIIIAGISIDSVTRASEKIQSIIDEAVKSPSLDYTHFISLPLAIHPELVDKLLNFQNSILGNRDGCPDDNPDSDSNEDTTDNEDGEQQTDKRPDVAVELKVDGVNEHVKVNITKIPLVSYAPKASKSSSPSDLGIDKSIFIKPKTFHLTILMLKLWNKDRVNAAAEVLQSISSKVMDALDNRPLSIRLKGLDCMRGSLAKARVLYAPVEEIGREDRLLRACQVIIDAYVEAGLVLEKDANQKLKLHATVMNAGHRKRGKWTRNVDSFDARGIFKQYGSEEWGQYPIREAHLSQRFAFDENGYYHCCASIPFPEGMQVD
ncbi:uncharacterized protein LOC133863038 isoform X2 [Alnus glutinosa]|uniref:uncharacterized protein LOC133863038 isoform X2 n=1 Tax=Alnus glutinosa TaxID=3517 RepID=UPI002D769996|nr:uncharacterized protein LOC133863038 isoform X2 [Alnus glutinosa]